jgi:hypothetical protein
VCVCVCVCVCVRVCTFACVRVCVRSANIWITQCMHPLHIRFVQRKKVECMADIQSSVR